MSPESKQFEGTLTKEEIKIKQLENALHDKKAEICQLKDDLANARQLVAAYNRQLSGGGLFKGFLSY